MIHVSCPKTILRTKVTRSLQGRAASPTPLYHARGGVSGAAAADSGAPVTGASRRASQRRAPTARSRGSRLTRAAPQRDAPEGRSTGSGTGPAPGMVTPKYAFATEPVPLAVLTAV